MSNPNSRFRGKLQQKVGAGAALNPTLPVFGGLVDVTPKADGSFFLEWAPATTTKAPLRYEVYVALGVVDPVDLFLTDENVAKIVSQHETVTHIFTLGDQETYFVKDQVYTFGIKAVDAFGFKGGPASVVSEVAIASGNFPEVFQSLIDQLSTRNTELVARNSELIARNQSFVDRNAELILRNSELLGRVSDFATNNSTYALRNSDHANLLTTLSGLLVTLGNLNGSIASSASSISNSASTIDSTTGALTQAAADIEAAADSYETSNQQFAASLVILGQNLAALATLLSDLQSVEGDLSDDVASIAASVAGITAVTATLLSAIIPVSSKGQISSTNIKGFVKAEEII